MASLCTPTIAAQHCNQVFIQSRFQYTSLYVLCHLAFTQYVIPTYFLTLPNSVQEEMFGITLLCNHFMLDSLLVCRRSSHGLSFTLFCLLVFGPAMPTVHVTVHPQCLHHIEAARAWHLNVEEGMSIRDVCDEVVNMLRKTPSYKAVLTSLVSLSLS